VVESYYVEAKTPWLALTTIFGDVAKMNYFLSSCSDSPLVTLSDLELAVLLASFEGK